MPWVLGFEELGGGRWGEDLEEKGPLGTMYQEEQGAGISTEPLAGVQ